MKSLAHPLAAAFLTILPLSAALPASATAAQEPRSDEFRSKFQQAVKIGASTEMAQLVRTYNDEAVEWIIEIAEQIAEQPSSQVYELMNSLRGAWKASIGTRFVEEMEIYFSLLDPARKRERLVLRRKYDQQLATYRENYQEKDQPTFAQLGVEFGAIARIFEQLGDKYHASQAWTIVGHCYDEELRKDQADLHKACEAFGRAVALRKEIGLEDRVYQTVKPRHEQLVGLGYGEEAAPGDAAGDRADPGGPPGGGEDGGAEVPGTPTPSPGAAADAVVFQPLTYELVSDLDTYDRPSFFQDEIYPIWNLVSLRADGSSGIFPRVEGAPPIRREGASDVSIDQNGDGAGDIPVPITGNLNAVEFTLGKGDSQRPWGFLSIVGTDRDVYQGIEVNLGPSDEYLNIYVFPAGSMKGTVGKSQVRIFDDNMDGVYGSLPQTYAHIGLTENHYQPELDSIVIGSGKRARPWSKFHEIDGAWYALEVSEGGNKLAATPVTFETGTLELSFEGGKPDWLVVAGREPLQGAYFDLAGAGSKGVEVPAGTYSLYYGELREGKKKQVVKSLILPGSQTPTWQVTAGGTTVVELGAPFGFDFSYEVGADSITVDGSSVVVTGSAAERYERAWGAVPRPEISYREVGARRGSKPEKMDAVLSQDQLYETEWRGVWHPLDTTVEKDPDVGEVEVQLIESKNKLFGKIESDWKKSG